MNKYVIVLLAAVALIPSCSSTKNYDRISNNTVGVPQQVMYATVTAAESVTIDSENTSRNLGTIVGAAVGAGAGQLLGRGKGRAASTVGFGIAGALAGRYLTDSMGRTKAQRLTVQIDNSAQSYTFVQPIYKQVGEISVGTHGSYRHGSNNAQFVPDGMSY